MALQGAAFLGAGLLITVLHTTSPDHWLPFVVVGRARRWALVKTLRLTLLSSLTHVGLTIVLGLAIALLSLELLERLEGLQGIFTGVMLTALGFALVALQARHGTCACAVPATEGAAGATVFSVVALAPCYPILPVFLAVQDLGWEVTLGLAALFAVVTVAMMAALVLAACHGLVKAGGTATWASLEKYEGYLLGGILVAVGLIAAWH